MGGGGGVGWGAGRRRRVLGEPGLTDTGGACAALALPAAVADMEVASGEGAGAQGGVLAPIAAQADEPAYTKRKVSDFLNHHTGAPASACRCLEGPGLIS